MSDISAPPARPVSLFTIVFVFATFAAFLLVIRYFYQPTATATFNAPPENLPKDLEWRASSEARRKTLAEVRQNAVKQATTYAWVDQKAGVVQLPVERAMELTVQKYGARK